VNAAKVYSQTALAYALGKAEFKSYQAYSMQISSPFDALYRQGLQGESTAWQRVADVLRELGAR
jgi:hypothetical protein